MACKETCHSENNPCWTATEFCVDFSLSNFQFRGSEVKNRCKLKNLVNVSKFDLGWSGGGRWGIGRETV